MAASDGAGSDSLALSVLNAHAHEQIELAVELWQVAHPERSPYRPYLGELVAWLMSEATASNRPAEACGEATPEGPCGLRAGHPVGPWCPGHDGHMVIS